MSDYDVVIAGGGHNALICACVLARNGLKVLVAERNDWVGGGVVTREVTLPGFRHDLFGSSQLDELRGGMSRMEFTLRFTLSHPGLHTTIVGTKNPDHLGDNIDAACKGPLPAEVAAEAKRRLAGAGTVSEAV